MEEKELIEIKLNDRDIALIDNAIKEYYKGHYDALKIECFNKSEADAYRKYISKNYPEVKASYSWLIFKTENRINKICQKIEN